MKNTTAPRKAAHSQINMMESLSRLGLPTIEKTLNYTRGALARRGMGAYVDRAYDSAKTVALEQAQAEGAAGRRMALAQGPAETIAGKAGAFSGAATAYAKESAGIGASKALATISQRNQLLNVMTGVGAGTVNLSSGFGTLTNRGLAAGLDAGNPTYEAVTGSLAAGIPMLLTALQRTGSSLGSGYGSNTGGAQQAFAQYPM